MAKMTCKDCIHFKICNDYVYLVGRDTKVACPDFKSTADVVPRSEVEALEYKLIGVMHSVDKWLDGDELNQDEVNRAITMREKTLRIVEKLESEIKELKEKLDVFYRFDVVPLSEAKDKIKQVEQEVARKIFADIKAVWIDNHGFIDCQDLNEIEKKYIGVYRYEKIYSNFKMYRCTV